MRIQVFVGLVLTGTMLLPACVERDTAAPPAVRGLAFNIANGTANPGGSGVYRFGIQAFLRLDYPDQGLIVRHFPADDSFERCGGSQMLPTLTEQDVTNPQEAIAVINVLVQAPRDLPVLIYAPFQGDKDFCDYLTHDWLYRGTGRLQYNDNDFTFDPSRTNAFGCHGEGSVVDHDGQQHRYTECSG